ncbi:MAG: hypothetical protein VW907_10225 [Opitutae bacterium]
MKNSTGPSTNILDKSDSDEVWQLLKKHPLSSLRYARKTVARRKLAKKIKEAAYGKLDCIRQLAMCEQGMRASMGIAKRRRLGIGAK